MSATRATSTRSEPWTLRHEARLQLARALALSASDPRSARFGRLLHDGVLDTAAAAAAFLATQPDLVPDELAPGERTPAALDLGALVTALRQPRTLLEAEYEQVFGLVTSKECPPYETDYCPQTFSVYRSQQLADIAGFYSAFGLLPSRDMPERHDHIALELEFLGWLLAKQRHALRPDRPAHEATLASEQAAVCCEAQQSFLELHLAWWLPAFARAVTRKAERTLAVGTCSYLAALASVLASWVPLERAALSVGPPTELAEPNPVEPQAQGCAGCSGEVDPRIVAARSGALRS